MPFIRVELPQRVLSIKRVISFKGPGYRETGPKELQDIEPGGGAIQAVFPNRAKRISIDQR